MTRAAAKVKLTCQSSGRNVVRIPAVRRHMPYSAQVATNVRCNRPHRALHTTLCSRVLLNLREAGANASGCFSHDDFTKHSRMVFATAGAIGTDMSDIPLTTLTQRSYDVHTFAEP